MQSRQTISLSRPFMPSTSQLERAFVYRIADQNISEVSTNKQQLCFVHYLMSVAPVCGCLIDRVLPLKWYAT